MFSLGGVLARWWPTTPTWLPWGFAAALLTAAAMWDKAARGAPIDFVLIGLAGYELVLGLTEERQTSDAVPIGRARR